MLHPCPKVGLVYKMQFIFFGPYLIQKKGKDALKIFHVVKRPNQ